MSTAAATDLAVHLLGQQGPEWDQPNRLYTLHRRSLGDAYAEEIPVPPPVADQHPVHLWAAFVHMVCLDVANVLHPGDHPDYAHPPVGVACLTEAWLAPSTHTEELHRRRLAGGSIPDFSEIPGREEVRMATVCLGQDVGSAQDIRGQGIRALTTDAEHTVQGRVVDAVRWASRNLADLLGPDHDRAAQVARRILAHQERPDAPTGGHDHQ